MAKEKRNWITIILNVFIIIMAIVVFYMLILKIIGESPTTDQIIIVGILMIIGAGMLNMHYKIGKNESKINNISKQFGALAHDFKEHIKR